ncbi:hypothetical protein D8B26_008337 [Coccidioides posadasii str. Silveira]|uniref:Uncharacterized protein n=2 Tax=Coccidioides posadasii TaxID=199306 RepID=A0A0J6FLJ8_COCPO|nr:hypothetical protein CPC735_044450 [Coccidioides posadasii C735 delta SOWgp]EER26001.1 hypothetical protein CPC735_044450 [Coccidioides posadasii C735 delta SOWgp]KMM69744.1 hypothetical protein CPAG_06058 [Coccidioides posadasii RMSCC 3488]QVM13731.1 hypothetical protein D8B26_008337 [Coccidioides posadasii str. Silveira]|eukprot:XP_003068146.1 hypothetical protein CPC735_044450 [Coccidioides posadasii C735 delta SOWgp]
MASKPGLQNDAKSLSSRPQKRATQVNERNPSAEPPTSMATDLLKALNKPVEGAKRKSRRKLQAQHKVHIKKAEEDINGLISQNKLTCSEVRKAQLDRLSDLVEQKAELEAKIISQLQSLNYLYKAATR